MTNLLHMAVDSILDGESVEAVVQRVLLIESKQHNGGSGVRYSSMSEMFNLSGSKLMGEGVVHALHNTAYRNADCVKNPPITQLDEIRQPQVVTILIEMKNQSVDSLAKMGFYPLNKPTIKKTLESKKIAFKNVEDIDARNPRDIAILLVSRSRKEAMDAMEDIVKHIKETGDAKPGEIGLSAREMLHPDIVGYNKPSWEHYKVL